MAICVALSAAAIASTTEAAQALVPNDPFVPQQYGLARTNAFGAWDLTTGSRQVTVAVVDDGVDARHRDLAPNLDMAAGRDFGNNDNAPTEVGSGHGSQTASVLGSVGNNAFGMAGVAWNVRIIPVKVRTDTAPGVNPLEPARGSLISAEAERQGFAYARDRGARVVNASFSNGVSGSTGRNEAQRQAIEAVIDQSPNTLYVVSAGNSTPGGNVDDPRFLRYPCDYPAPNLICVGGTDENDGLWPRGNFGARSVDLAAPAAHILTTRFEAGHPNEYELTDGTSYAAPLVSGTAALYFSRFPDATVADARKAILSSVDKLPSLAGRNVTGGRLNIRRALDVKPAPTRLTNLRLSRSRFRAARSGPAITAAKTGTKVSYSLVSARAATFRVQRPVAGRRSGKRCVARGKSRRKVKRCTRWVNLRGSITVAGGTGKASFQFHGRLRGRRLARGRYRLYAQAIGAGKRRSAARVAKFTVVR